MPHLKKRRKLQRLDFSSALLQVNQEIGDKLLDTLNQLRHRDSQEWDAHLEGHRPARNEPWTA